MAERDTIVFAGEVIDLEDVVEITWRDARTYDESVDHEKQPLVPWSCFKPPELRDMVIDLCLRDGRWLQVRGDEFDAPLDLAERMQDAARRYNLRTKGYHETPGHGRLTQIEVRRDG